MADRVGVINKGRILLVDEKEAIMRQLGTTEARFILAEPMAVLPPAIARYPVSLEDGGRVLAYRGGDGTGTGKREVAELAQDLTRNAIAFIGLDAHESSLEEIFVKLVHDKGLAAEQGSRAA
jgi:ABC-2 type transport system ATP-binding protein